LKRLGTALHVVQQRIIVRDEPVEEGETQLPKVNSLVMDQKRMRIGKVFDVFGPVRHPYLIVKLNQETDAMAQVGRKLYVEETPGRDNKWKK
jgi:RNA-binding protein